MKTDEDENKKEDQYTYQYSIVRL